MDREHLVIKCVGEHTDIPVPRVFALCQDHSVLGSDFFIMEFVKGRNFGSPALHELTPPERRACYRSAVETLAKLHAVDWRTYASRAVQFNTNGGQSNFARQSARIDTPHEFKKGTHRKISLVLFFWGGAGAIGLAEYGQCGNYYGRQLRSLQDVSAKQAAVGATVPAIPKMAAMVDTMARYLPDDEVCAM